MRRFIFMYSVKEDATSKTRLIGTMLFCLTQVEHLRLSNGVVIECRLTAAFSQVSVPGRDHNSLG